MHPPLLLAQLGDWVNPPVPPQPQPGILTRFALESPTTPAVGLLLVGLLVLIALNAQGRLREGLLAAAGAIVAAGAFMLTAMLVETDRERLLARQDALVRAVAGVDLAALDELLAADARMRATRLVAVRESLSRDAIISTVDLALGKLYPVSGVALIERQGVIDGRNAARTQAYVSVQPRDGQKTLAWVAIAWRLEGDGAWRVIEIEPLFISGVMPYQP